MRVGVDGHWHVPHVSVEAQVALIAVAGVPVYGESAVEPPVGGDDWHGNATRNVSGRYQRLCKEALLSQVESTDFLQAVSMLHTLELRRADVASGKTGKSVQPVSAKRVSILAMPLSAYAKWADEVEAGFLLAAKFLRKEYVKTPRELPYRTQLAPLASVLAHLRERWLEPRIYQKLSHWYWSGVLGELYGSAIETRIANDVEDLLQWIDSDDAIPRTIADAAFSPDRLDTMTSRLSAAYKGLNVLVLREGAQDFFWKAKIQELDDEEWDEEDDDFELGGGLQLGGAPGLPAAPGGAGPSLLADEDRPAAPPGLPTSPGGFQLGGGSLRLDE